MSRKFKYAVGVVFYHPTDDEMKVAKIKSLKFTIKIE